MTTDFYSGTVGAVYASAIDGQHFDEDDRLTRVVASVGGTALELGSGTGRLLLRLLASGHDVHGVEISADMISRCRADAAARGLEPVVHEGTFAPLDPELTGYSAVICPLNGFSFVTDDALAVAALRSFVAALTPGGVLALTGSAGAPDLATRASWVRRDDVTLESGVVAEVHELRRPVDDGRLLRIDRRIVVPDDAGAGSRTVHGHQLRRLRGMAELAEMFDAVGLRALHAVGSDEDYLLTGRR